MSPCSLQPLTRSGRRFVLMTAAYNEETQIEKTITSVLHQTVPPRRWMIVSDGSTDRTDEIVKQYARQHDFIRFLRVTRPPGHSFASKTLALKAGLPLLQEVAFDFIGNLDADISVEPDYFEQLIIRFEQSPQLGLVSGFIHEETGGEFRNRSSNRIDSVPHAAQLVRRECYEAIGGYAVLKYGGEDWYAQTCARLKGWTAEAIPELEVFHHRHTGAGTNLLGHRFRLGRLDYSVGSDPLFEVFKCLQRIPERPLVLGGFTRLAGFTWCCIRRESRQVSRQFIEFLRCEQKQKIAALFSGAGKRRMGRAASRLSDRSTVQRVPWLKVPMSTSNRQSYLDYRDPLGLFSRALTKLHSLWVSRTYPFASVGSVLSIHPSVDLYRAMARRIKIGNSVLIAKDAWLNVTGALDGSVEPAIILDDNVAVARRSQISAKNCVHLERDVILSPSVLIMDHNHAFEDITVPIRDQGVTEGGRVRIEQGSWIGHGAVIVCDSGELIVGRNSVVAANSVVTRSFPPYSVISGNPARVVKQFDPLNKAWVLGSSRNLETAPGRREAVILSVAR